MVSPDLLLGFLAGIGGTAVVGVLLGLYFEIFPTRSDSCDDELCDEWDL